MRRPLCALPVCIFLVLALGAPFACADDESGAPEPDPVAAAGALYAETGTADVVMEKEYIELRDAGSGATRAVFQFRNTRAEPVTVVCVFPIRLETSGSRDDSGFVSDLFAALGAPAAGTSREFEPAKLAGLFGLRIQQDGREIPVDSCVADSGTEPGHLVLHFRNTLHFSADGTSMVSVTCTTPPQRKLAWNYILETGSSWKESLRRIVLSVPPDFHPDLEAPWQYVGTRKGRLLYTAADWKPGPGDTLSLAWKNTLADYPEFWRQAAEPIDPDDLPAEDTPVVFLEASSFLREKADVFLPGGIWHDAPFDPVRLFDGLPETAWVVRTPRGGIGEWVRFALDSSIERVEIANGWQRSAVDFPDKDTWSYFGKNNRVKTLDILRDDGSLVTRLALADTREIQRFNISLPAGTYRAVIADIFRGTRWNDTCLGELRFVRGTALGFDALARDPFFSPLVPAE